MHQTLLRACSTQPRPWATPRALGFEEQGTDVPNPIELSEVIGWSQGYPTFIVL
jgi:hypothetical protein